jgi:hypothetical protein
MQSKSFVWKTILGIAVLAMIASCTPSPTAVPSTQAPTVNPQPTYDAVSTQAVQTFVVDMTKNAPTATQVIPTDTPMPTNTVPPLPTNTPVATQTPTKAFIAWTSTPTATQAAFGCSVTDVSPKSSDTIKINQDFDGKWTVKNTGTKTWSSGNTDIKYVDGTKLHTGGDLMDLTSDVAPNGTYSVVIDMKAPGTDGQYKTNWAINLEDGTTCTLSLTINVTN